MAEQIDLQIDVTDAAGLNTPAHIAVTVTLPEASLLTVPPVVCFGFPGGGYNRQYFSLDLRDSGTGGQANFHARRGWVFVSCDHLGVGQSTVPQPDTLDYETISKANAVAVDAVMRRLTDGDLTDRFPALPDVVALGIGQSMGGCFTIVLQARHRPFAAVGLLGYSAVHTVVPNRPGTPAVPAPWIPRDSNLSDPLVLNAATLARSTSGALDQLAATSQPDEHPWAWAFHFDDVPDTIVQRDLAPEPPLAPWRSPTIPACALKMLAPGTVATEAAAIDVPVLVAVGERDVVPDPRMEPKAYASSPDITLFVCPGMAHMHNFAGSRTRLWERIHSWGTGVAAGLQHNDD